MSEWITSEKPDTDRKVLICTEKDIYFGKYSNGIWYKINKGVYRISCIRGWQELPERILSDIQKQSVEYPFCIRLIAMLSLKISQKVEYVGSKSELVNRVNECLNILTEREKQVLIMRYMYLWSLSVCGKNIGVTRERIRQIEAKALFKLRSSCFDYILKGKPISNIAEMKNGEEIYIETLGLSTRSYNCLKRAGYNTLEDISNLNAQDIFRLRNVGAKTAMEIMSAITSLKREQENELQTDTRS